MQRTRRMNLQKLTLFLIHVRCYSVSGVIYARCQGNMCLIHDAVQDAYT